MTADILVERTSLSLPIELTTQLPLILASVCGGLLIALLVLGVLYWQLRKSAQATQSQLESELDTLKQESQATQTSLENKIKDTTETLQATQLQKADLETLGEALKQQCKRLRETLDTQSQQVQQDTQAIAFEQIQTLLTQYPTLRRMAESKPELPARNLVATLTTLDNLVQFWGYEPIGEPWATLAYDPQQQQGDAADLQVGETVYVRFVGYREAKTNRILIPAKVSRTLPGGVSG